MSVTINGSTGVTFPNSTLQTSAAPGGGVVVSSATDVTLTNASVQNQRIAMTTSGKSVSLPNATTVAKGSYSFVISNNGNFPFSVTDGSGSTLAVLFWGDSREFGLVDNATSAGVWNNFLVSTQNAYVSSISDKTVADVTSLTSSLFIVTYYNGDTYNNGIFAVAVSVSGGSATWGTPATIRNPSTNENLSQGQSIKASATNGMFFYGYYAQNTGYHHSFYRGFSVSGTTITLGTETSIYPNNSFSFSNIAQSMNNGSQIVAYTKGGDVSTHAGQLRLYSVSGSTVTQNQSSNWVGSDSTGVPASAVIPISTTQFILCKNYYASALMRASTQLWTISGTTWSSGAETIINPNTGWSWTSESAFVISSTQGFCAMPDGYFLLTVSGTTVSGVKTGAVAITFNSRINASLGNGIIATTSQLVNYSSGAYTGFIADISPVSFVTTCTSEINTTQFVGGGTLSNFIALKFNTVI